MLLAHFLRDEYFEVRERPWFESLLVIRHPPPAELMALMLQRLDASYTTCCQRLDIPKAVKKLGYFDPSIAVIRGVEYEFFDPEVHVPESVAKPKPKPQPKNAPMQRSIASYFQPQPPSDDEA